MGKGKVVKAMSQSEWYEKWFQEDYLALYPNRDEAQAIAQVESVLSQITIPDDAQVLDMGCGTGRHLRALQTKYPQAMGLDLSPVLLREASQKGAHNLIRADFRELPLASNSADLVCSFFSSFGYFSTRDQDWDYFHALLDLVKVEGYLFIDLPDGPYNVSHLPPDNEIVLQSGRYLQKRRWDGECIRKRIYITRPDGTQEEHQEQLRLFSYSEVESALMAQGFEVQCVFGNEKGEPYSRKKLPRMSFLAKRVS